ncbi:hypothetical protein KUF71_015092 [Frankliniella fusca]|uniref:RNA-directed DNA polymerase n=1 Tax=Frankliniella fusca TaxID=407009 RepID=A0AAE1HSN6_9NEOP|nr:hypothetical protein KUF71_015092 [Frankliniella fusca]
MASYLPISPPEPLCLEGSNVSSTWKNWKEAFADYVTALSDKEIEDARQVALFRHVVGDNGRELLKSFTFLKQDGEVNTKPTLKEVFEKFDAHIIPKTNLTFERFQFFTCKQKEGEPADAYVAKLRQLAKSCDFGDLKEELIRDIMVAGLHNHALREKMLQVDNLTLAKCVDYCRTEEVTRQRSEIMKGTTNGSLEVEAISRRGPRNGPMQNNNNSDERGSAKSSKTCNYCGMVHRGSRCPAYGKNCNACNGRNHFAAVCKKKYVKELELEDKNRQDNEDNDEDDGFQINMISLGRKPSMDSPINANNSKPKQDTPRFNKQQRKGRWYETIAVTGRRIRFKIDTGADINTLPRTMYHRLNSKIKLLPVEESIYNYSRGYVECLGRCYLPSVINEKIHVLEFYIIDSDEVKPVIGWESAEDLGLVIRVERKYIDAITLNDSQKTTATPIHSKCLQYEDCFKGIGKFSGEYHIELKDNAVPVVHAPRKIPFAVKEPLRKELKKMEQDETIKKVEGPADWVNSMVIVHKKDSSLRVCLDPRDLNKAIKREHRQLPTLDDFSAAISGNARAETAKDSTLQMLRKYIRFGWPVSSMHQAPTDLQELITCKNEIYEADGLLMKGTAIIVPATLKKKVLDSIHFAHQGIEKCKARARGVVFWPKMNAQIMHMVQNCSICCRFQNSRPKEPLQPFPVPEEPWAVLAADAFEYRRAYYLLVVDYFSKFTVLCKLANLSSMVIVSHLKSIFSQHGSPQVLVTDNATNFVSSYFKDFAKDWEFQTVTSSPHYAQSNGMAERHVQTIKKTVKKALEDGRDPHQCVLEICSTPVINDLSPAQVLMGRRIRGKMPLTPQLRRPQQHDHHLITKELRARQAKQKAHYDQTAAMRKPLHPGPAYARTEGPGSQWTPVNIISDASRPRSYTVRLPTGNLVDRSRRHIHQPPANGESRQHTNCYSVLFLQEGEEKEMSVAGAGVTANANQTRATQSPPTESQLDGSKTPPQRRPGTTPPCPHVTPVTPVTPRGRPGKGRARRSLGRTTNASPLRSPGVVKTRSGREIHPPKPFEDW